MSIIFVPFEKVVKTKMINNFIISVFKSIGTLDLTPIILPMLVSQIVSQYCLKHCHECNMEKIARGCSRETNIARGKAKSCIRLETKPECYFFHIGLTAVL